MPVWRQGGVWDIKDTGEEKVTLVVGLVFEYSVPKNDCIMNSLVSHNVIIKIIKKNHWEDP